ncbi:hypothetical protein GCM10020000_69170 [Streptomyces olivoverticillatus]
MNTSSLEHTSPTAAPPRGPGGADPTRSLLDRLAGLRQTVTALVERRSADDPTANDPLRGLYLSEEAVRHLLRTRLAPVPDAAGRPAGPTGWPEDTDDRLAQVAVRLRLTELDTAVLLIALAPRPRPHLRTALRLPQRRREPPPRHRGTRPRPVRGARAPAGGPRPLPPLGAAARPRPADRRGGRPPAPDPLVVRARPPHRPLARRRHPGCRAPRPSCIRCRTRCPLGAHDEAFVQRLATRLGEGPFTAYLREHREGDALATLASALHTAGVDALRFHGAPDHVPELLREARLSGRAVVVCGLPDQPGPMVGELTGAADVTVLLADPRPYDPQWSAHDPLVLQAPRQPAGGTAAWRTALGPAADCFDLA